VVVVVLLEGQPVPYLGQLVMVLVTVSVTVLVVELVG